MKNSALMGPRNPPRGRHEPGFIADAMLGTLAKWLRILGVDVEYEKTIGDQQLIRRALDEDRVVLTRDTGMAGRRWSGPVRIESIGREGLSDQLRQVVSEYAIRIGPGLFSRCIRCNAVLKPYSRNRASGRVPAYILRTHSRFKRCPVCGRIYWPGSHQTGMTTRLRRLLESASTPPPSPGKRPRSAP